MENQVFQVLMGSQVQLVHGVNKDRLGREDNQVPQDPKDHKVNVVKQDQMGRMDNGKSVIRYYSFNN